jgi:hypothetical protein
VAPLPVIRPVHTPRCRTPAQAGTTGCSRRRSGAGCRSRLAARARPHCMPSPHAPLCSPRVTNRTLTRSELSVTVPPARGVSTREGSHHRVPTFSPRRL